MVCLSVDDWFICWIDGIDVLVNSLYCSGYDSKTCSFIRIDGKTAIEDIRWHNSVVTVLKLVKLDI